MASFDTRSRDGIDRDAAPRSRSTASGDVARRVIVIDDNPAIHEDFRKILCPLDRRGGELDVLEADLFGAARRVSEPPPPPSAPSSRRQAPSFELYADIQGREGCDRVGRMMRIDRPIALAFVDMRMPPGWDGVETAAKLWAIDPHLEIVICSAYSDLSWAEVTRTLKRPELRLLRKPFEAREVLDLAWELTGRWWRRHESPRHR